LQILSNLILLTQQAGKYEFRSPKNEINPNFQTRRPNFFVSTLWILNLDFALVLNFVFAQNLEIRISNFVLLYSDLFDY